MIAAIAAPSIFPPLRMTPTRPAGRNAPLSSAAMPSAPEGSTTSFIL